MHRSLVMEVWASNAQEMEKIALPFLLRNGERGGRASQSFASTRGWVRFCTGYTWNLPSEGKGVGFFRLVSPAEGTGALAPVQFNLLHASACMNRHPRVKVMSAPPPPPPLPLPLPWRNWLREDVGSRPFTWLRPSSRILVEPHLVDAEFREAWLPFFCRSVGSSGGHG